MTRSARRTSTALTSVRRTTRPIAAGRTNATRPPRAFLSRPTASRIPPARRSETGGRGPMWSTAEAMASKLDSASRPRRHADEPPPHGLAVGETSVVRHGLEGVSEGVAEVQDAAKPALPLVPLDDL